MWESNWWRVEVTTHDGTLVAIEPGMLAGKGDLSPAEQHLIRDCAEHLLSFVGPAEPAPCFFCGGSGNVGVGGDSPAEECPLCGDMPNDADSRRASARSAGVQSCARPQQEK